MGVKFSGSSQIWRRWVVSLPEAERDVVAGDEGGGADNGTKDGLFGKGRDWGRTDVWQMSRVEVLIGEPLPAGERMGIGGGRDVNQKPE